MKRIIVSIILLLLPLYAQQSDTLYLVETTDVHGTIQPYDYFRDQPAERGLAKAYTKIVELRRRHRHVILLDNGDLLQGTPLIYLFNHEKNQFPNPMILTLNYMGYDAFTVGNHDIEQGWPVYMKTRRESDFPWLSANGVLEDGRTLFEPYTIIECSDIKIGVIGLTTPGIPMWLDEALYPGVSWGDMIEYAKKYAELLRPKVDILVGLFHAGFNEEYSMAQSERLHLPNENASSLVARQVPEFDIVFAGHSHREIAPDKTTEGPLLLNAGSRARKLAVAKVVVNKETGPWQVAAKDGWLEDLKTVPAAQSVLQLTDFYHRETLAYIRREMATLDGVLDTRLSRFTDTPLIELINRVQMEITGAPIAFASCFNDQVILDGGTLRVKDIYRFYPYENYLYTIKMSGAQIRRFLEYSARWYVLRDGKLSSDPDIRGYNYDMAEGLRYTIQVNRQWQDGKIIGKNNEVTNLTLPDGQPLINDKEYLVAMNSYRASGGGGHLAAAGITEPQIVWKSHRELRTLLIEYFKGKEKFTPTCDHNWNVKYQ